MAHVPCRTVVVMVVVVGEGRGRGGGLGVAAKNHGEAVSCSNK